MSGAVPARLAASFTLGENAVLSIIARQVQKRQVCVLPIDAIGAMAGVSRTVVKDAIREAKRLGLLEVRERRIAGQKSLPNIVRVIDLSWLGWLRLGAGKGIGVRNSTATDNYFSNLLKRRPPALTAVGIRGENRKFWANEGRA